jgi:hypothetical protein
MQRLAATVVLLTSFATGLAGATFLAVLSAVASPPARADELAPQRIDEAFPGGGDRLARFSERTLVVGIELDRDDATLLAYTLKPRPYLRAPGVAAPRPHDEASTVQIEVVLQGPGGLRHTRRIDAGPLCLLHHGDADAHVAGDTIRVHRDSMVVELPEREGFDRIEVAYYQRDAGHAIRLSLGIHELDRARFVPAGSPWTYADLAFAVPADEAPPPAPLASDVLWPEDFDDPELYQVFGDVAESPRGRDGDPLSREDALCRARSVHQLHPGLRLFRRVGHRSMRLRHRAEHGDGHALPATESSVRAFGQPLPVLRRQL